jgi:hypothetical protein
MFHLICSKLGGDMRAPNAHQHRIGLLAHKKVNQIKCKTESRNYELKYSAQGNLTRFDITNNM